MSEFHDIYYTSNDGLRLYARDYAHANPRGTLLCLHGLTRNSADFGNLCAALSDEYRIVAVDQRGRGLSDYDPDPSNYNPQVYIRDMLTLLDHLGVDEVVAIGTSMGGIISMGMGATAVHRLKGVVLNDVGPQIDPKGLERIRNYVGKLAPVTNWDEAMSQVRSTNEIAFPDYVEEDWAAFARNVYRDDESGIPVIAHDPAISESVKQGNVVVDLWPVFDALADVPLLVIRGATSDILASDCVDEMRRRRSDLHTVEVAKRGHAPMLDEPEALAGVRSFLDSVTSI